MRVDKTELLNMVYFKISDKDTDTTGSNFNPSLYTFATNDSNFFVQLDQSKNQYSFNLRGFVNYVLENKCSNKLIFWKILILKEFCSITSTMDIDMWWK